MGGGGGYLCVACRRGFDDGPRVLEEDDGAVFPHDRSPMGEGGVTHGNERRIRAVVRAWIGLAGAPISPWRRSHSSAIAHPPPRGLYH